MFGFLLYMFTGKERASLVERVLLRIHGKIDWNTVQTKESFFGLFGGSVGALPYTDSTRAERQRDLSRFCTMYADNCFAAE